MGWRVCRGDASGVSCWRRNVVSEATTTPRTGHRLSLTDQLIAYRKEVARLKATAGTTETSYYPALTALIQSALDSSGIVLKAVAGSRQESESGTSDLPDVAVYSADGQVYLCPVEVKKPGVDLRALSTSTDQNDQIGRYLARSGSLIVTNADQFLLVTGARSDDGGPVPPEARSIQDEVLATATEAPEAEVSEDLAYLVRTAVLEHTVLTEPRELARILAHEARLARQRLPRNFSRAVTSLLEDFANALGLSFDGDEGDDFLRSSLVQTVFYALFAGWALWSETREDDEPFDWRGLSDYGEIPFLGELFYELRHPTRLSELGLERHLDRAAAVLAQVNSEAFFAKLTPPSIDSPVSLSRSAIVYFYEPFLEAFDPDLRKELGVWYTPPEVVQYQVEQIDRLLRTELGREAGLADPSVTVLDPCCGTGAYLFAVLGIIARHVAETEGEALVGARLLEAISTRVVGFELLTAPFVVTHLQLHLLFAKLGIKPQDKRPAVFLSNALTGWYRKDQVALHFPGLQEEYDRATDVKRSKRIIVVLGNPPYNRFAGVPVDEEADLADPYKGITRDSGGRQVGQTALYEEFGVRKHLLDDLYIRFFRLAEERIRATETVGVVSFISNYSFLAGQSHPLMRRSLLETFDLVYVDALNGDKYRTGKVIPKGRPGEGQPDQSVFSTRFDPRGIQVGTAITTLVRREPAGDGHAEVWYRDFWGRADKKRASLLEAGVFAEAEEEIPEERHSLPEGPRPYQKLEPSARSKWLLRPTGSGSGYDDWIGIDQLFPVSYQGVNHNRGTENSVIDDDRDALKTRMLDYFSDSSHEEITERYPVLMQPRAGYEPEAVRDQLRQGSGFDDERIVRYAMYPLDARWIYYESEARFLNRHRPELWECLSDNEFLVAVPRARKASEALPVILDTLFDLHHHDRGSVGFPLMVRGEFGGTLFEAQDQRRPNIERSLVRQLLHLTPEASEDDPTALVKALFRFVLAILHSPVYQEDNREALDADWARVPIPRSENAFRRCVELGATVASLLDPTRDAGATVSKVLGSDRSSVAVPTRSDGGQIDSRQLHVAVKYFGSAPGGWEAGASETDGRLRLNDDVTLEGVSLPAWQYRLGGYPVIKKWLGYREAERRKRPLTLDELSSLRSIVQRVTALTRLNDDLNEAFEAAAGDALGVEDLGGS